MRRRTFVCALGAAACSPHAAEPALASAAFEVARRAGALSAAAEHFAWNELHQIVSLVRGEMQRAAPEAALGVLAEVLFAQLGFAREVDDKSLAFVLLPNVLRGRRGSCVGLGMLLLVIAEALGQRAQGILMPGHFYVRLWAGARSRNVELLRRGEAMPEAWYAKRFPVPGEGAREYARPLSNAEALGVVEYDVGTERRRQLRLDEARAAYERAIRGFPDFAEAHASLGATLHLLGRLDEAQASYERAKRLNPALEGVTWNRALLEEEQRAAPERDAALPSSR